MLVKTQNSKEYIPESIKTLAFLFGSEKNFVFLFQGQPISKQFGDLQRFPNITKQLTK
jgi:hypothetical protein